VGKEKGLYYLFSRAIDKSKAFAKTFISKIINIKLSFCKALYKSFIKGLYQNSIQKILKKARR